MTVLPSLADQLSQQAQRLQACCQENLQRAWVAVSPLSDPDSSCSDSDTPLALNEFNLNEKEHLAWPRGRIPLWLGQTITVPSDLAGYALEGLVLRLQLTWWAEVAQIYVNGALVQEGDLFDHSCRICLSEAVTPGDSWHICLQLVSPDHDPGALVRSLAIYESATGIDPGFVAQELEIVKIFLGDFSASQQQELEAQLNTLARTDNQRQQLDPALATIHDSLKGVRSLLGEYHIHLSGHAHLDLAWLWPMAETWEAAKRTFVSVLQLHERYPELTFSHSSPALYAHLESTEPELFQQIQVAVAQGWWEVAAGLWVEPELNLISGESLARQILYGQRYVQEKFGSPSAIAWLPDSFGFCQRLPHFLKQGGIEYFVTQKLRWNDTTVFPYGWFAWQDVSGDSVLSLMSAPIGEGIDPVKMAAYARGWYQQTGNYRSLWLPGVGDHGGGPTADMLEIYRRWQRLEGFIPPMSFTTVQAYVESLKAETPLETLSRWQDELYLEFHRGCYTSHSDQKQSHQNCEQTLLQAELWSSLAAMTLGVTYPGEALEQLWKLLLFQQFHDILPGTAIAQVYEDANQAWTQILRDSEQCLETAQTHFLENIAYPAPPNPDARPLVVFNSLSRPRTRVVRVDLTNLEPRPWQIKTLTGDSVPYDQGDAGHIQFVAVDVPPLGYALYWLCPAPALATPYSPPLGYLIENNYLHVEINAQTGEITNLYDKVQQQFVLRGPGNQLQCFQDQGQYWDAWNIDPDYENHLLEKPTLKEMKWVCWNPLEQRLRVTWQFRQSQIQQDYCLESYSPLLRIETVIDWQESHILLKAAFPLAISAPTITCETPGGITERPTLPNPERSAAEHAKWEVPFLHWADLSTEKGDYGLSLLTRDKHGLDAKPDQLRLTLLRSPSWPDPKCDRGRHWLSYGLYPHGQTWQEAQTPHQAQEFNSPLQPRIGDIMTQEKMTAENEQDQLKTGNLPPEATLLAWDCPHLQFMALKQGEDQQGWMLRCAEISGHSSELNLSSGAIALAGLEVKESLTLLEAPDPADGNPLAIKPWHIHTWRINKN